MHIYRYIHTLHRSKSSITYLGLCHTVKAGCHHAIKIFRNYHMLHSGIYAEILFQNIF